MSRLFPRSATAGGGTGTVRVYFVSFHLFYVWFRFRRQSVMIVGVLSVSFAGLSRYVRTLRRFQGASLAFARLRRQAFLRNVYLTGNNFQVVVRALTLLTSASLRIYSLVLRLDPILVNLVTNGLPICFYLLTPTLLERGRRQREGASRPKVRFPGQGCLLLYVSCQRLQGRLATLSTRRVLLFLSLRKGMARVVL